VQRRAAAQARSRLSRGTMSYSKQVVHRSSQVPGESIPCLCPALGSRPVRPSLTLAAHTVQSPPLGKRRHQHCGNFGTQSRGFDIRCLRFKSCVTARACKARFRWVVSPCREGVEPSGFHRKVSVFLTSSFPRLVLARPKTTPNFFRGFHRSFDSEFGRIQMHVSQLRKPAELTNLN